MIDKIKIDIDRDGDSDRDRKSESEKFDLVSCELQVRAAGVRRTQR